MIHKHTNICIHQLNIHSFINRVSRKLTLIKNQRFRISDYITINKNKILNKKVAAFEVDIFHLSIENVNIFR